MKWAVGTFGVLVAILIFFWGDLMADYDFMGGHSPEFGNPIAVIGVVLFIYILGASWAVAAMQTFGIIISAILLVVGVSWIQSAVTDWSGRTVPWPGFIFMVAGLVMLLFHLKILGLIRRFGKYLWATKYRRLGAIITTVTLVAIIALVIMVVQSRHTPSIVNYDGSTWSEMSSGTTASLWGIWSSGATNNLYDIWGSSASDVFAVGPWDTILHYDGSSWSPMSIGTTNRLLGIWSSRATNNIFDIWGSSSSDVFAVGNGILHYDGSSWNTMSGNLGWYPLYGVWGSSASDVFAVGFGIVQYDGSTWSLMRIVKNSGVIPSGFRDIWGTSASDVFVVGNWGTILHYDGTTWSEMSSGTKTVLQSVWGSSASDVFVIGW